MRKADNLTTILCRCHEICETLTSWNPLGPSGPVTGLLYLFTYRSMCAVPQYDCLLQFLDFMFSRYIAHVISD